MGYYFRFNSLHIETIEKSSEVIRMEIIRLDEVGKLLRVCPSQLSIVRGRTFEIFN